MFNYAKLSPSTAIKDILPRLVEAAQKEVDDWEQDEDGNDPMLGQGGICEQIASALVSALNKAGLNYVTLIDGYDEHSDVTLVASDGVWRLDVPWQIYEIHHGYCRWEKIKGAKISDGDIMLEMLSSDPAQCALYGISDDMLSDLKDDQAISPVDGLSS
jgi:hypothetical protein